METFIGQYDHILSRQECNRLIELFESSSDLKEGECYNGDLGVHHDMKKSIEMNRSFDDNTEMSYIIGSRLKPIIDEYFKKYSLPLGSIARCHVEPGYNIQRYTDHTEGFKKWHCEDGGLTICHRVLVWMIYLNDAQSGTDFYYYDSIKAKEGRCVIWPSSWTHTHRSTPNKGLKYVVTGWISYF